MIEKTILDYLNDQLEVSCYMERPKDCPEQFVVLERTSGRKTNHLSNATFAIQSHAQSMLDAASLNELVKTAMESAVSLTNVFSVKLNSDYNYTNSMSFKGYRYQAVFFVIYKE